MTLPTGPRGITNPNHPPRCIPTLIHRTLIPIDILTKLLAPIGQDPRLPESHPSRSVAEVVKPMFSTGALMPSDPRPPTNSLPRAVKRVLVRVPLSSDPDEIPNRKNTFPLRPTGLPRGTNRLNNCPEREVPVPTTRSVVRLAGHRVHPRPPPTSHTRTITLVVLPTKG